MMKGISLILTEQLLIESRITQSEKMLEPLFNSFEDEAKRKKEDVEKIFDHIKSADPSGNQKYLTWLTKEVIKDLKSHNPDSRYWHDYATYLSDFIEDFHELLPYITNKDINSYSDVSSAIDVVHAAARNKEKKELEKKTRKEVDRVYENDQWKVLVPKSYESSCMYGQGTKWCTASRENSDYYQNYMRDGVLLYFIDKVNKSGSFYKFAFFIKKGEFHKPLNKMKIEGFDEVDEEFNVTPIVRFFPIDMQQSIESYLNGLTDRKMRPVGSGSVTAPNLDITRWDIEMDTFQDVLDEGDNLELFLDHYYEEAWEYMVEDNFWLDEVRRIGREYGADVGLSGDQLYYKENGKRKDLGVIIDFTDGDFFTINTGGEGVEAELSSFNSYTEDEVFSAISNNAENFIPWMVIRFRADFATILEDLGFSEGLDTEFNQL